MKPTLRSVYQGRALTAGGGIRTRAAASLVFAAILAWPGPLFAQSALPSVEVDLSVVDELAPGKPEAGADPVVIQPPRALKAEQEAAKAKSREPAQKKVRQRATSPSSPAKAKPAEKPSEPEAADKSGAAAPETEPTATAATAAADAGNDEIIRLIFGQGSAELPGDAETKLGPLAERMKQDDTLRVQLLGYAASKGPDARESRRLSLSRALAVRLYLTKQGVGGTRALVRPLGSKTEEEPLDRVDVVVVK